MKKTVTQFVYMAHSYTPDFRGKEWVPAIKQWKQDNTDESIFIGAQEFEVEIPDDFDPTAKQVAALEKLRDQVRAEFTAKLNEISDRIGKLQALPYEVKQ